MTTPVGSGPETRRSAPVHLLHGGFTPFIRA
jgi:hypothetical protein